MKRSTLPIYLGFLFALSGCGGAELREIIDQIDQIGSEEENSPPSISGAAPTSVKPGEQYSFTPSASDPDNDPLSFVVINKPNWLAFDTTSGELSGIPDQDDVKVHPDIEISVSDGELTSSLAPFSITVQTSPPTQNSPPSITGTPSSEVFEGQAYAFTPSAADPEGDELTFSINNQPNWLTFDSSTGALFGVPDKEDAGDYPGIQITVSDSASAASLAAFSITVHAAPEENLPPAISGTPSSDVREGETYSFIPLATDPEDDELTFSISNQPSWLSFDDATGMLTGVPGEADIGLYTDIEIIVTDGKAETSLPSFDLTVHSTSATLSWAAPVTREDGSPLPFSEIGGYKVYTGTNQSDLDLLVNLPEPNTLEYKVSDLAPGTHYFAVTVYNVEGSESEFSEIVNKAIQ